VGSLLARWGLQEELESPKPAGGGKRVPLVMVHELTPH